MVNKLDRNIIKSEVELQSLYDIHPQIKYYWERHETRYSRSN